MFVSCLFTDDPKCKRNAIVLRFGPPLSLWFPTLVPPNHHKSLDSLPGLVRQGCHCSTQMERKLGMITYCAGGKNTDLGGSDTYVSGMPPAWSLTFHVPQLSDIQSGDRTGVKNSFMKSMQKECCVLYTYILIYKHMVSAM